MESEGSLSRKREEGTAAHWPHTRGVEGGSLGVLGEAPVAGDMGHMHVAPEGNGHRSRGKSLRCRGAPLDETASRKSRDGRIWSSQA